MFQRGLEGYTKTLGANHPLTITTVNKLRLFSDSQLPSGWEAAEGKPNYIDHDMKATTWVNPSQPRGGSLLSGWEARLVPGGRIYSIDKRTTWDLPHSAQEQIIEKHQFRGGIGRSANRVFETHPFFAALRASNHSTNTQLMDVD
jgi:hypothetical protein